MTATTATFALPALKRFTSKESQYDFSKLTPGSEQCIVELDVIDAKKAHGRLTSAVGAWKKREGSTQKFTVRTFQHNGKDAVGVWALVGNDEPKAPKASAPAAAPVADTATATEVASEATAA